MREGKDDVTPLEGFAAMLELQEKYSQEEKAVLLAELPEWQKGGLLPLAFSFWAATATSLEDLSMTLCLPALYHLAASVYCMGYERGARDRQEGNLAAFEDLLRKREEG